MAKVMRPIINGTTKNSKKGYAIISNMHRKVKKTYNIVDGYTRLAWSFGSLKEVLIRPNLGSTDKLIATSYDFETYDTVGNESNVVYDVFYHDGYMYRVLNVKAGTSSILYNTFFQRKKVGDTVWSNVTQLTSNENSLVTVTYNRYEKIFTFCKCMYYYTLWDDLSYNGSGGIYTCQYVNGVMSTWTNYCVMTFNADTSYPPAYVYYASNAYYFGMIRYSGAYQYYTTFTKYLTNEWTSVYSSGDYPTYMNHLTKFKSRYIGVGDGNTSYAVFSIYYNVSTSSSPNFDMIFYSKFNRGAHLQVVGDYIYVFGLNVEGSAPSAVSTIPVYRSSDGITFTLYTTINISTGSLYTSFNQVGFDGEFFYYVIQSPTATDNKIMKTKDFLTCELINIQDKYIYYGATELI